MKKFSTFFLTSMLIFVSQWLRAQPMLLGPINNEIVYNASNVYFDWNALSGSSEYRIQVALSTAGFSNAAGFTAASLIQNQNTSANTFATFSLAGGKAYAWAAKGSNSNYSSRGYFLVRHAPAMLLSPLNGGTGSNSMAFSWNSVTNANDYRLQISSSSSINFDDYSFRTPNVYDNDIGNYTAISLSNLNLSPGTYYWHVRGGNNTVGGAYSEVRSFVIPVPCNISVSATPNNATCGGSNGSISASGSGASSYQYKLGNGSWQTSNSFSSLAAGSYTIHVRDANNQSCTNFTSATVSSSGSTPTAPSYLDASDGNCGNVSLSWGAVSGATSYKVYRNGGLLTTVSSSSTTDNNPLNGSVNYAVEAINDCGTSGQTSDNGEAVAIPSCPIPNGLQANASTTSANVSWNASADAQSYVVYWLFSSKNGLFLSFLTHYSHYLHIFDYICAKC